MKKAGIFFRFVSIVLSIALIFFTYSSSLSASARVNESYLFFGGTQTPQVWRSGGIQSLCYYYYNPNAYTNNNGLSFLASIKDSVSAWNATGAGCNFTYAQSQNSADVYFVFGRFGDSASFYAGCWFYTSDGTRVNAGEGYPEPTVNWDIVYIRCNVDLLDDFPTSDSDRLTCTFEHELGHSMGLAHVDLNNQIMYDCITAYYNTIPITITTPQSGDIKGIKKLSTLS